MKKTALLCIFSLLVGCTAGLLLNVSFLGGEGFLTPPPEPVASMPVVNVLPAATPEPLDPKDNTLLLEAGNQVLEALKERDLPSLATLAHPEFGVTFTPYSTVSLETDINLKPQPLSQAQSDKTRYIWGITHGTGGPIQLTISAYIDEYVFNADYTQAPLIGVDKVLASGNSLENVQEAYPDARFIEYYFPGVDPANEGFDWCALKLVFQEWNGAYKLVGIIHSEWTI